MHKLYGYPKLMKAGIGNMLVPWAKCFIWCKDNNIPMIDPFWSKLRVGPYLRGERDKRNYQKLFVSNGICGLRRLYLLLTAKKQRAQTFALQSPQAHDAIVVFEDMSNFDILIDRHQEIKLALQSITKAEYLPSKASRPFIGIHVRQGDYLKFADMDSAPWLSRLPLEWYTAALCEIRKMLGFELEAVVFSDGADSELSSLITLPNVSRSPHSEAITDIFALSGAAIIIGSCSSFSMWGAYLAQTLTVWYKGRCPGKVLCDHDLEAEWLEGDQFPTGFAARLAELQLTHKAG